MVEYQLLWVVYANSQRDGVCELPGGQWWWGDRSAVSHLDEFCYSITKLAGAKAPSEIENAPLETDNGVPVGRPRKSTG